MLALKRARRADKLSWCLRTEPALGCAHHKAKQTACGSQRKTADELAVVPSHANKTAEARSQLLMALHMLKLRRPCRIMPAQLLQGKALVIAEQGHGGNA